MAQRQEILTRWHRYSLYDVASALQKSIRRGDWKLAGWMALELFPNYADYCWRRLLTISAEDCYGCITKEVMELCNAFYFVNKGKKAFEYKGRIFISKAVMILAECIHSRDTDLMQNFVRDKMKGLDFEKIQAELDEAHKHAASLPDYVYDCHTIQGKIRGKTKAEFFIEEERALKNKQPSLFDINELMK